LTKISYKASVSRDLKHLDRARVELLLRQLTEALDHDSDVGVPLKGEFEGLYKLRIGDYRVIYAKTGRETVVVLRIGHRSKVYLD
jgi:mRNA interferase RelE/StbE